MARLRWAVLGVSLGAVVPALQAQEALRMDVEIGAEPRQEARLDSLVAGRAFQRKFRQAARKFDVPAEILLALSYAETRWQAPPPGVASLSGGYGLLHLSGNGVDPYSLDRADRLTGLGAEIIRDEDWANVLGGAAVLRSMADDAGLTEAERKDPGAWFEVLATASGLSDARQAADYAEEVLSFLREGVKGDAGGEEVILPGREVELRKGRYENLPPALISPDFELPATSKEWVQALVAYPSVIWNPAYSGNYSIMNRPTDHAIDRVVIHTVQGSYSSAINWFKNPSANVSAHYVIRSNDGQITQMVREKDNAWHVGCWNSRSIGIEHEGYMENPSAWFTDAMYRASAKLVAAICDRYGIPKDRTHVVGHDDVSRITGSSCTTHTDPGSGWDWARFMGYVANGGAPAFSVIVDNGGAFTASGNWGFSSFTSTRYGADYRYATPYAGSDAAWFNVTLPSDGAYEVFAWWPANAAYNSATPFVVMSAGGSVVVHEDQRVNGGKWNSLGTFSLKGGKQDLVGVSRWSSASGYVIADAVRIVAR